MQLNPSTTSAQHAGLVALLGLSCMAVNHTPAHAIALDEPSAQLKWLDYQERQQGQDRMRVQAWATRASLNLNDAWGVQAYTVVDSISGASPVYYASPDAFANVSDRRKATDLRLLHVTGAYRVALGGNTSRENDYQSDGSTLQVSRTSDDQNITWDFGWAHTQDQIHPANKVVTSARKNSHEQLVGVRWNASELDALQVQATRSTLNGYLNDPYKFLDQRPGQRIQSTLMVRWSHHVPERDSSLRWTLRGIHDTWGAHSFMTQAEWAMPLTPGVRLTPSLRYYTQNAARFFSAPSAQAPLQPNIPADHVFGRSHLTMDQRLSALGAITAGLQLDWTLTPQNQLNLRWDAYRQREAWAGLQQGTPGMATFRARFVQVGWSYHWER